MIAPRVSAELVDWANSAGYSFTPVDASGGALFWTDPGGELRFYIRGSANEGFILTSAERSASEQFELSAYSMASIERHLFGVFGSGVRSKRRLARLVFPRRREELAVGYQLDELDRDGYRRLLFANELVATARGDITSISVLTKLSYLLSNGIAIVKASYEDAEGRPLFKVRK